MISLIRDFVEGFSRMESVLESVHLLANEIYHHPLPVILLNGRNVYLGCLLLVLPTSPTGVYLSFWSRQITFLLYPSSPTLEIIRYPRVRKGKKHETVTSSSVTMHIWLLTRTMISRSILTIAARREAKVSSRSPYETTFPFSIPFDYSRAKKREKKYNGAYFQLEEAFFAWPVSRIPDSVLRSGSGMQRRRGGSEDRGCTIRWVVVSRVGGLVARPLMRTGLSPVPYSLLHAGTGWWPSSTWLPEIYRAHDARDTVWMYEWTYGSCESCYRSSLIERGRERIRVD